MRWSVGHHSFEDQDFVSITEHARKLEGLTLAQIAEIVGKPELLDAKGKGVAGQLLQTWFRLPENDNRAEPDIPGVRLPDGRIVGLEIKAVPLMPRSRGFSVKERCKVTSINYSELLQESWENSRARHKLLTVLFIFYRYAGSRSWADSQVEKTVAWFLEESSVRETIRTDWQRTWGYVDEGRAHDLSEGQALVLGSATSGAGHESKHVGQPKNPSETARKRSFALKPSFLQTTYEAALKPRRFASITTLRGLPLDGDIQSVILGGLKRFVGWKLAEIAAELGLPQQQAKQGAALIVRRALGVVTDERRLLELEAAGVKPKTVPVREEDLWPLEAMSFPVMRLVEFAEEDWEDSELRTHLDCLLLLPFLAEKRGQEAWDRRLARPFFWTPTGVEEEGIASEWRKFQKEVQDGNAAYTRENGRRVSKLTPGSRTTYLHLRPKGPDGSVDDVDPLGRPTQQLCFWLNRSFVQSILRRHLVAS